MNAPDAAARFGSGQAVLRIEDRALLEGLGRFTDNVAVPGQAVIAFLRSPHPHARIASIDADAARGLDGVLAVYTGADLVAAGVEPMPTTAGFKRA
ncbi:MAG TPA: xanthine dehydrogenase family protein molybdopterin-binding subunit, partial [Caldimonas sp.]|nr:xanthine dehydrogenase family protein molybdopterin-binding subunit [Caldimonas sp.]